MIEKIAGLASIVWRSISVKSILISFAGLIPICLVPYFRWVISKKKLQRDYRQKQINNWYQWVDEKNPYTWWPYNLNPYPLVLGMIRSPEYKKLINYFSIQDRELIEEVIIRLKEVNTEFESGIALFIKPLSQKDYQSYVEYLFYSFKSILTEKINTLEHKWGLL